MTSYQKLKQENEKLKQHIFSLVMESDKPKGIELKMRYTLEFRYNDSMWQGSTDNHGKFRGILSLIKSNPVEAEIQSNSIAQKLIHGIPRRKFKP